MPLVTEQQLINASRDADDLGLILNGDDDLVVTTRLGRVLRSLANVSKDLSQQPYHLAFSTRTELLAAVGPFGLFFRAEVRADPAGDVVNGNGVYRKTISSWVWISDLPPDGLSAADTARALLGDFGLTDGEAIKRFVELYSAGSLSLGFVPGTTSLVSWALVGTDRRPAVLLDENGLLYTFRSGVWYSDQETPLGGTTLSLGFLPGTTDLIIRATLGAEDGVPQLAYTDSVVPGFYLLDGATYRVVNPQPNLTVFITSEVGLSLGFLPETTELVTRARITRDDGKAFSIETDATVPGVYALVGDAYVKLNGPDGFADEDDPQTFDAGSASVPVPSASVSFGRGRTVTYPATTVTSPATANVVVTDYAIAAGVSVETWLPQEEIVTVTQVRRVSDNAVRTLGTHYTQDLSSGRITNLTADALEADYTGSLQRKDLIVIDPQDVSPVPEIVVGTEVGRTAYAWKAAVPAGRSIIAEVMRKGSKAFFIPRTKWRNGYHVDRAAEEAALLDYNRPILAPIRNRFANGLPVRIIAAGNSRAGVGAFGAASPLNLNPNSRYDANPALSYIRDNPGFFERIDGPTRVRLGFASAAERAAESLTGTDLFSFDTTVGHNLSAGTADGWGASHCKEGYVWKFILEIIRMYPMAVIDYRNWSIGGTNSSNTLNGNGTGNALWGARWSAIQADIISGQTLFIPVDAENELGQDFSHGNWTTISNTARDLGAVVHFMGNSRPDPRWASSVAAAAFSAAEQSRAAWDTGAAVNDSWRLLAPENLCGLGFCEDEIKLADLRVHDGPNMFDPLGVDVARSYA